MGHEETWKFFDLLQNILLIAKNVERFPIQKGGYGITGESVKVEAMNRILTSEVRRLLSPRLRKKTTAVWIVLAPLNSHIVAVQQFP